MSTVRRQRFIDWLRHGRLLRAAVLVVIALSIAAIDLLPVALVLKQAFTPERESLLWPPTWWPRTATTENFEQLHSTVEIGRSLGLSLWVACLTVASTLALSVPAAWIAARGRGVDRALESALGVARLFPTVAIAIPLATAFVALGLYNHPAGLGLWAAHTLLALPVAFFLLRTAFRAVPPDLEEAARLDGAGALGVFWRVSMPLVRPALAAAALLVFLMSWDEIAYALLLQVTNRPLPAYLYYLASFGYPGLASAVAVVMLVPAIAIVLVLQPAIRSGAFAGSGR